MHRQLSVNGNSHISVFLTGLASCTSRPKNFSGCAACLNPRGLWYTAVTSPPASLTASAADLEYRDRRNVRGGRGSAGLGYRVILVSAQMLEGKSGSHC